MMMYGEEDFEDDYDYPDVDDADLQYKEDIPVNEFTEVICQGKRHWRYNPEDGVWICPACTRENKMNYVINWQNHQLIMTPRIFTCRNPACHVRRLFWRDSRNILYAEYIGKYDSVDEIARISRHDPVKFYQSLKSFSDPNQLKLL